MPIPLPTYEAWVNDPDATRCILIRLKGWVPNYNETIKAFRFNNTDYIALGYPFSPLTSFSISFYFSTSTDTTGIIDIILDGRDAADDGIVVYLEDNKVKAKVNNIGIATTNTYDDSIPHHVLVSWDGSFLSMNIDNGGEVVTPVAAVTTVTTTANAYLGARSFTSQIDKYTGDLWNVSITIDSSLEGYYRCDDQTGTTAKDSSGNNNDGTITAGDLGLFHTEFTWVHDTEVSFYVSSIPFSSSPDDSDPNKVFNPVLDGDITISYKVPFFEEGQTESGFGEIIFDNTDHTLDDWINYDFGGREFTILWGDPSWTMDDFLVKPLVKGLTATSSFEGNEIKFKVADKSELLNRSVTDDVVNDTTPPIPSSQGQNLPLTYGRPYQIEPICIDEVNNVYQWSQGASDSSTALTIYDLGVTPVAVTSITYASSQFELTANPEGKITIDANGVSDLVFLTTVADIVKDLVTNKGDTARRINAFTEIDSASFNQMNTDVPYTIATYISDKRNLLDELDWLLLPLGCFWYFDGDVMYLGRIEDPSLGTSIGDLDGTVITEINISPLNTKRWRTRIGYKKNWAVQDEGSLAASLVLASKQRLSTEFLVYAHENPSVKVNSLNAIDADILNTAIVDEADAITEATRQQNILENQCYAVDLELIGAPLTMLPGQIWTIYDYDYGFSAGRKVQIIEIEKNLLDGTMKVKGWFKI
jgi:hypothetical protein